MRKNYSLEELLKIKEEAERIFEREYQKALLHAKRRESNPKKALEIARKVAMRKMNEELLRKYSMRIENLEATITAKELNIPLSQLAV